MLVAQADLLQDLPKPEGNALYVYAAVAVVFAAVAAVLVRSMPRRQFGAVVWRPGRAHGQTAGVP